MSTVDVAEAQGGGPGAAPEQKDLPDYLNEIKEATAVLERSLSGYTTMANALHSLQNPAARKVGVPLFTHAGSLDGVKVHQASVSTHDMDPAVVPHVLNAFAGANAKQALAAAAQLGLAYKAIYDTLVAAFQGQGPAGGSPGGAAQT